MRAYILCTMVTSETKKKKKDYLQSFKNYSYSEILAQDTSINSQPGNYHYIPTEHQILGTVQS